MDNFFLLKKKILLQDILPWKDTARTNVLIYVLTLHSKWGDTMKSFDSLVTRNKAKLLKRLTCEKFTMNEMEILLEKTNQEIYNEFAIPVMPQVHKFFTDLQEHLSPEDRSSLKATEFLPRFVNFLHEILGRAANINLANDLRNEESDDKHRYVFLKKGLDSLLTILRDVQSKFNDHEQVKILLAEFEKLVIEVGSLIYSCLFEKVIPSLFDERRDAMLEKIELLNSNINTIDTLRITPPFQADTTGVNKIPRMEGMREISKAFYDRASEDEKELVTKFFNEVDVNGDGNITMSSLKDSIGSWYGNEIVFNQLDKNGDGMLDFDDVLLLHYLKNKANSAVRCDECRALVDGLYFTCMLCRGYSYDICCICYRGGHFNHKHEYKHLLDTYSLLKVLTDQHTAAKRNEKAAIEELCEIARSHYRASTSEVKQLATEFFDLMDVDGDNRVDLQEFLTFMRDQGGHPQLRNRQFFKELDRGGKGTLDFDEVVTLYYIIKSGRPFCDCCGNFIPGLYFSCVDCFNTRQNSFHMCHDCYRKPKHFHNHDGRSQFLDNYTLLEATRNLVLAKATDVNQQAIVASSTSTRISTATVPTSKNEATVASSTSTRISTATVPTSKNKAELKATIKALDIAVTAISVGSAVGCSIM